jgi:mannose/fructose-specific phosphotransferase system component IIA
VFRALVVGQGDFAAVLVSAVREISGRGDLFVALSNQDFPADMLERRVREELEGGDVRVVFTDLPGGSAALAAHRVMRDRSDVLLVTGANLAALLEFALSTAADPDEAARIAAAKGQAAIGFIRRG